MTLRKVYTEDSVGMVLGHDLAKNMPGYGGQLFKKGHVICAEDIPYLKNIGIDQIFLIDLLPGQVHENDAIARIAQAVAGENVMMTEPSEGRINIQAQVDGLLKVNRHAVTAINAVENAVVSTRHDNILVKRGDLLAGIKVVPLVVDETMVLSVESIANQYTGIISVKPLRNLKVGAIITGNEVYYGRIKDRYAPIFAEKVASYGATMVDIVFQPDDRDRIAATITEYKNRGMDVIIATGGMSVDPNDVTPDAIRATGAQVVTYGTAVLPGAMFMLAYHGDTVIMGMPGCGMYAKITIFDLVFPRVLAGEWMTKLDFASLGYGGLCLNCKNCTYPVCPFGK
ncbi:molybdenum cofactor synthesis domain-containing protein [Sporomusaceae bacterium BoRhaA]|uniref:molybdopterin-binding protein n=1 Tax=Pelorhabdus rhamnosifermentans TaxID=2772457 RepID=UPI001C06001B|nr:molybdopterin-binding protein [Pelorhabdus rhamnosifermentans]MBU2702352.1 molybdenum cofactor synthesis domain-containing protein [Pelorhabdus rhamnosifermentans]